MFSMINRLICHSKIKSFRQNQNLNQFIVYYYYGSKNFSNFSNEITFEETDFKEPDKKKISRNQQKKQEVQRLKFLSITKSFNDFYIKQYGKERWSILLNSLKNKNKYKYNENDENDINNDNYDNNYYYCLIINKFFFKNNKSNNDDEFSYINDLRSNSNPDIKRVEYINIPCYISKSKFPLPIKDENNLLNVYHIDLASVMVTMALDIQPNDIVLDLCAAPGGKSLAILQRLLNDDDDDDKGEDKEGRTSRVNRGGGMLIANEINNKRFHRLLQVIKSYIPFRYHQYQIKLVKNSPTENYCYDKILVDVPCSSELHLINNQDEFLMWKESRSKNFSKKQYNILLNAVKALKINGILVYSTCSISNLENDHVIKKILVNSWVKFEVIKRKGGWEIGEETEFGWIILPDKCDGWGPMYFSILKRVGEGEF